MSSDVQAIKDIEVTLAELMAADAVKQTIAGHIEACYKQLMKIKYYIDQRNAAKPLHEYERTVYFGKTESIEFVNDEYDKFLKLCKNPGVKTVLEVYASLAKPKHLVHKLTATVQAHSAEMPRTRLLNKKVLTLSLTGRPVEPGLMAPVKELTTMDTTHSAELDPRNYSWGLTILKKLVDSSISGTGFIARFAPTSVIEYIHKVAKRDQPKIYGIDFWWSWYIYNFGLYEVPTEETKIALYTEYEELYSKIHKPSVESIAHLLLIRKHIFKSTDTDKTANLYNLARFLRTAWAGAGIVFPGGGFNIICAHRDHNHYLQPNIGENPDLCPTYGVSIVETTNPADSEFTNKGLRFLNGLETLAGDAESIQKYRMHPHLADGANFAPMPDKMLENIEATYHERCNTSTPNVNLLDQQLYWLNKIFVFCEDSHNEMVYYALLFLEMCVNRRTSHSAMINMFQQGMGYVFTCLDPSCRFITELSGNPLARAALQVNEYTHNLKIIEKIVNPQPIQHSDYVKREYNVDGIWAKGDTELTLADQKYLEMVKTDYKMAVADKSDTRIRKITRVMTQILKLLDDSPHHIKVHDAIFMRIKQIFFPALQLASRRSSLHPRSPNSPNRDSKKGRAAVGEGGKMSSTRKRVMPVSRSYRKHRRNGSRKNKRYIRYTKTFADLVYFKDGTL